MRTSRWSSRISVHIRISGYLPHCGRGLHRSGGGTIRFKSNGSALNTPEVEVEDWLPSGPVVLGLTAGASTPNNKIGEAVERVLRTRGITPAEMQTAGAASP